MRSFLFLPLHLFLKNETHTSILSKTLFFYLGGDQPAMAWVERLWSVLGAFIGLMLVLTIAESLAKLSGLDEWLMATLGASALLVFALPQSPMSQSWAVIAGNTLSALVGISGRSATPSHAFGS